MHYNRYDLFMYENIYHMMVLVHNSIYAMVAGILHAIMIALVYVMRDVRYAF